MIEEICKWLTPIIPFSDYNGNWKEYNTALHDIFKRDFIDNPPKFNGKKVNIRINPKENGFEHAFIHLTCVSSTQKINVNDRLPDMRRCERLEWNKEIIENYQCSNNCLNCHKVLYYETYYSNKVRVVLLFYDVRFKVILEKRDRYYLLITGYYIEYEHTLKKEYRNYKLYQQQKTPLS